MNEYRARLEERIGNRSALVGIVGLGYVGLPLAMAFSEKSFDVLGFDVDTPRSRRSTTVSVTSRTWTAAAWPGT